MELMEHFFRAPDERVFGEESAVEVTVRFGEAVDAAVKVNAGSTLAIVTHGTVLALYAAPLFGLEPYFLWTRMSHPSFVVLDPDARAGVAVVESVA